MSEIKNRKLIALISLGAVAILIVICVAVYNHKGGANSGGAPLITQIMPEEPELQETEKTSETKTAEPVINIYNNEKIGKKIFDEISAFKNEKKITIRGEDPNNTQKVIVKSEGLYHMAKYLSSFESIELQNLRLKNESDLGLHDYSAISLEMRKN